jgi:hypothetical protein
MNSNLQRFLRSFSGTGTTTKCRSRHKTCTGRTGPVNTGLKKAMMITFLCRYWITRFRLVPVLCRDRHFVLVPVPLIDRKKRCILRFAKKNFSSELRFFIEEKRTKLLKKNSHVIVMYIPLNLGQDQGGLLRLKSKYLY